MEKTTKRVKMNKKKVKTTKKTTKTAPKIHLNDVVDDLVSNVSRVLKYKAGIAFGLEPPEDHYMYNMKEQENLLEIVKPMLATVQQTRVIEAESAKDVIKLISNGKVTVSEATMLLSLMKTKNQVEESEMKNSLQKDLIKMLK